MKELRKAIVKQVDEEYRRANDSFPMFNSRHEGMGVMLEEVREAVADANALVDVFEDFMDDVCNDRDGLFAELKQIEMISVEAACEMVQVSAMAKKFIESCIGHAEKIRERMTKPQEFKSVRDHSTQIDGTKSIKVDLEKYKELFTGKTPDFKERNRVTISIPKDKLNVVIKALEGEEDE